MSLTNSAENDILKLIFQAVNIANLADNASVSANANLFVSLHIGDPGEAPASAQETSEATYTGYARVSVARTAAGWSVSANQVTPVAAITFPAGTGGAGTVTHFGVGTELTGVGKLLLRGTVTPNIVTGNGVTPELTTSTQITLD